MPELPDVSVYVEALQARIVGRQLLHAKLSSPFLLRTVQPSLQECERRTVVGVRRLGKRIEIQFEGELFVVVHLMIAGRFHWYDKQHQGRVRASLLQLEFESGTLTLTEAGTKRRASIHVLGGLSEVTALDRGGLEIFQTDLHGFRQRLSQRNHTLKRALIDPSILSGIGNAYSDEILHSARLSPLMRTASLSDAQWQQLFDATKQTLNEWTSVLRAEAAGQFPEKVTAFRAGMAVHGRYGKPCPMCNTAVQRIRYAEHETSYCPRCQTGGKLLADRSLSRLLKADWPKTIDALENLKAEEKR